MCAREATTIDTNARNACGRVRVGACKGVKKGRLVGRETFFKKGLDFFIVCCYTIYEIRKNMNKGGIVYGREGGSCGYRIPETG